MKFISGIALACWFIFSFPLSFSQSTDYQQVNISSPPDYAGLTNYGHATSIDGDMTMIGAYWEDSDSQGENPKTNAGAVYVWKRTLAGDWAFHQKLVPTYRRSGDAFGYALTIHGSFALISAPGRLTRPNTDHRGVAFLYQLDLQGYWEEIGMIHVPGGITQERIGWQVALSERYAVLTAHGITPSRVAAYVFEKDHLADSWSLVDSLMESDPVGNDIGRSVAIWQDYVVLGAPQEDRDEDGLHYSLDHGAAYVYQRDSSSGQWEFLQKVVAPDRSVFNPGFFGTSVAFHEGQLLVGAPGQHFRDSLGNWTNQIGIVAVFERNPAGRWVHTQTVIPPDAYPLGSGFGTQLAAKRGAMITGAPHDAYLIGPSRGAVYFYEQQADGQWTFVNKVYEPMNLTGPDHRYGSASLDIDGPSAVVGTDYRFGYAYHYEQCVARHELVKVRSCEPLDYYGTWLDSSGLYEVEIEADWACDSLSATVQFELVEVDTSVLQTGNTLIATAEGASFQWLNCNLGIFPIPGATDSIFTATIPGLYAVAVTQAGCTERSECRYVAASTANEEELAQQIRLFPNPTSSSIQVDLSAITQAATLRLTDAKGRQLMQRKAAPGVTTLDMKAISPSAGLFFLEVQAGERQAVLKVMVN